MPGAESLGGGRYALSGGQVIANVHSPFQCAGEHCTIHNWSDHAMVAWPQIITPAGYDEKGIQSIYPEMYRLCPHNGLHCDPDVPGYAKNVTPGEKCWGGCDGCCLRPEEATKEAVKEAVSNLIEIKEGLE